MKPSATKQNIFEESNFFLKLKDPLVIILIFLAYFVSAKVGLMIDAVSGFATLAWLPSGIALASVILLGRRVWPAIAWAAFVVNFQNGAPFFTAAGIGLGNGLEALFGAYLLKKYTDFQPQLNRQKDVVYLLGTIIASTSVSATIGSVSLALGSVNIWEGFFRTWSTWWVGDIVGSLVAAPFILVWAKQFPISNINWRNSIEPIFLGLGVFIASQMVFGISSTTTLPYFNFISSLFPFLVWGSLRFRQVGSVSIIFYIYLAALWGTLNGWGPFAQSDLRIGLLTLHGYIAVLSTTTLFLSSTISERKKTLEDLKTAEGKLRESHTDLENIILKRTIELRETNEPTKASPPASPKKLSGTKVLLVEDSPDNQLLVSRLLKNNGADVDIAENGKMAIEKISEKKYQIILMDLQMPVMDGYQATEELRKNGCTLPIIALTAQALKEERTYCLAHGFNEHVTKPIHAQQLIESIIKLT